MTGRQGFVLAGSCLLGAALTAFAVAGDGSEGGGARRDASAPRDAEAVAREIDAALAAAWKAEGLVPAARCSDEEFVRRVHLDLVGTIPSVDAMERFLADTRADKRDRLVAALIGTPGYSRHFANLWGEALVGAGGTEKDQNFVPAVFRPWLERELAARRPYPELVRAILTATGSPYSSPPVNFFGRRAFTATDLAGGVSQAFLGVKIQCAQCHDHPYEDITQKDFEGMAAFFARMTLRPAEIPYEQFGERAVKRVEEQEERRVRELVEKGTSEAEARLQVRRQRPKTVEVGDMAADARLPKRMLENPKRLEKVPAEVARTTPKFLHGAEVADAAGSTRRRALADWIADPANPYTARALANRYWGWLLGRGFVHPVDDWSSVNRPSVPAALEILARDTGQSGFGLDRLVRVITATKAYQATSATRSRSKKAEELFAVGAIKPFSPQQTFDSLQVALGIVADGTQMTDVDGSAPSAMEMEGGRFGQMAMMKAGDDPRDRTRTMLALAARSFFQTFDDDEGGGVTSFEGTVPQGLFLLNSQVVNGLLANPQLSILPKVLADFGDERARIRHLFLRTLARTPTEAETTRFLQFVKSAPERAASATDALGGKGRRPGKRPGPPEMAAAAPYADVLWALVSSSEFATNH